MISSLMQTPSYRTAFIGALVFHIAIVILLIADPSSPTATLAIANEVKPNTEQAQPQPQAIQAASVDNQEVMNAVNRLKEERTKQHQAEVNRQKALANEALKARRQREAEQRHLEQLKLESAKLAQARQQKMHEEEQRLKDLAARQALEEKRLEEVKKAHEVALKKAEETAKAVKAAETARQEEAARQEALRQKAVAEAKAAAEKQAAAQKQAQLAGVVDKYKALIVGAISRQWILPENTDSGLSSQFRIRLDPTGAVLDVTLTKSSGNAILDRSAQSAIYKASPLPVPSDPEMFRVFRDISLTVRPENARG